MVLPMLQYQWLPQLLAQRVLALPGVDLESVGLPCRVQANGDVKQTYMAGDAPQIYGYVHHLTL